MTKTRLYTYLLGDLDPGDVKPPLGMFQALRAQPEPTRRLVHSLNRALNDPALPEPTLDKLFDLAWPSLKDKLDRNRQLDSARRTANSGKAHLSSESSLTAAQWDCAVIRDNASIDLRF
jgi:hypothetical protein